jgi:hypothetical protein
MTLKFLLIPEVVSETDAPPPADTPAIPDIPPSGSATAMFRAMTDWSEATLTKIGSIEIKDLEDHLTKLKEMLPGIPSKYLDDVVDEMIIALNETNLVSEGTLCSVTTDGHQAELKLLGADDRKIVLYKNLKMEKK